MEGDLSGEEMIWHFGELAAIATVADVVELTGENRLIVQKGLECITLGEQIGVKALIEVAGLDEKRLDSTSLAFGIAPRINAAGRLGQADLAMELLLSDRFSQAFELATELNSLNEHRKQLVEQSIPKLTGRLPSIRRSCGKTDYFVWKGLAPRCHWDCSSKTGGGIRKAVYSVFHRRGRSKRLCPQRGRIFHD